MTPEQIAGGWIAHDGGACPVETTTRILAVGPDPMRDHFEGLAADNNWGRTTAYRAELERNSHD